MRKKCKRVHYRTDINPIEHAIDGARLTSGPALDKLRIAELQTIESFAKGQATQEDYDNLRGMVLLTKVMALGGVGPEALPACELATIALNEIKRRFDVLQVIGTTGPGLQSFRELYWWHDLQRTSISLSEYERWIHATNKLNKQKAAEPIEL